MARHAWKAAPGIARFPGRSTPSGQVYAGALAAILECCLWAIVVDHFFALADSPGGAYCHRPGQTLSALHPDRLTAYEFSGHLVQVSDPGRRRPAIVAAHP